MSYTQEQVDVMNADRAARIEILQALQILLDYHQSGEITSDTAVQALSHFVDNLKAETLYTN